MKEKNEILESIELRKNEWDTIRIILATTEIELENNNCEKEEIEEIKNIRELIELQLELNKKLNKKKSH